MPFSARQGFYGVTRNWWEVSNTEILSDIATWRRQGNVSNQSYTSLSGLVSVNQAFWAGVVHPNGNIYYAPYNQTGALGNAILSFNPAANTITTIPVGIVGLGPRYQTGVLAKDNKIYFLPYITASGVLIVDPSNNSVTSQSWGFTLASFNTYSSAVYAQDENKIYAIGQDNCLIINLNANTAVRSNLGGVITGTIPNRHVNGVYSLKTKKVIFAPYTSYGGSVSFLIINPQDDTAQKQTFGRTWVTNATNNIRNAGDGNIYITAESANATYRLDETANTITTLALPSMTAPNGGGQLNDGNLILGSTNATQTGSILDVYAGTWASNTSVLAPSAAKSTWLMHPDGNSYSLSMTVGTPVVFRTQANGTGKNSSIYSSICLSSYFNRAR